MFPVYEHDQHILFPPAINMMTYVPKMPQNSVPSSQTLLWKINTLFYCMLFQFLLLPCKELGSQRKSLAQQSFQQVVWALGVAALFKDFKPFTVSHYRGCLG